MEESKGKGVDLHVQGTEDIITSDSANVVTERQVADIFLYEVTNQCKFALMAFEDLTQALSSNDTLRIWYSIHAFLAATGNISKLLWPIKPRYQKRGAMLRKSLSIGDNSPLKRREFRDYLEHFDERLENWVKATRSQSYIDLSFGFLDKETLIDLGHDPKDILRYFNHEEFVVIFRDDTLSLRPSIDAVKELKMKAEEKIEKLGQ
jgi:hypothetical protein